MVNGFINCVALRDSSNGADDAEIPPAYPSDFVKLKGRDISRVVVYYQAQFDVTFAASDIYKIGSQFNDFVKLYASDLTVKAQADSNYNKSLFDAWALPSLANQFDYLIDFVGGLASSFPNTTGG